MNTDITLQNVSVSFLRASGNVCAVRDVSAVIKSGEVTGIVGESGSGKSVLGMSILKLLPANAAVNGNIIFQNQDLLMKSEREMNSIRGAKIGLIPQSPSESLNPSVKIGTQVAEPFTLHMGKPQKEALRSAAKLLERFHLPNIRRCMSGYGFQLSGGMKQRVVSTFGIGADPQWVIADEPTKGLDRTLDAQITDTLNEISKKTSMLLITHDLLLAQKLCSTIIVMHNGTIIEQGSADILSNPLHPYTRGLVASIPSNGMTPMPFMQEHSGNDTCPLSSWCPLRSGNCNEAQPPLMKVGERQIRCFHYA